MQKQPSKKTIILKIAVIILALTVVIAGSISVGNQSNPSVSQMQTRQSASGYTEDNGTEADQLWISTDESIESSSYNPYSASYAEAEAYSTTFERKLIRSVSLTLYSSQYEQDLQSVFTLLEGEGGYVEYSYKSGDVKNGQARKAILTLRVPSEKLDSFLADIQNIGRVTEISENTVDQTTQYYDNETRLTTLHTKLERLNELMKQASDVSDLIEIESEVSNTQYEIDSYETAQRTIQNQVDMSEVSLTLREETEKEIVQVYEKTLSERISAAFKSGWKDFIAFLENVIVFLTMALPVIVLLAVVLIMILLIVRRKKKHRQE